MRREDVHIPEPCPASWHEMEGDAARRFCDHCAKHVHDLSAMSRADAEAFLAGRSGGVCVQYLHDDAGELVFRDDPDDPVRMFWQRDGVRRLVAAAALVLPASLAAGCDTSPPPAAAPQAPIQRSATPDPVRIDADGARLDTTPRPGAGRAPAPPAARKHTDRPVAVSLGTTAVPVEPPAANKKPACDHEETRITRGNVAEPPGRPQAPEVTEVTPKTPAKTTPKTTPKRAAKPPAKPKKPRRIILQDPGFVE